MRGGARAAALVALAASAADGQLATRARWEVRGEGTIAPHGALLLGAGVSRATSTYTRIALVAAVGSTWTGGAARRVGRVGAQGRFVLDPFRLSGLTLYGAGGGAILLDRDAAPRPVLTVAVGVEGPPTPRVNWAVEGGLGGGARVAVILWRQRRERNR